MPKHLLMEAGIGYRFRQWREAADRASDNALALAAGTSTPVVIGCRNRVLERPATLPTELPGSSRRRGAELSMRLPVAATRTASLMEQSRASKAGSPCADAERRCAKTLHELLNPRMIIARNPSTATEEPHCIDQGSRSVRPTIESTDFEKTGASGSTTQPMAFVYGPDAGLHGSALPRLSSPADAPHAAVHGDGHDRGAAARRHGASPRLR